MSNIKERLDRLREQMQSKDFLEGKGLSYEVNYHIFCYKPEEEMIVKQFVDQVTADQALSCHVIEYNLYRIFIKICEDLAILDSIPEMEEAEGDDFLLEQLHSAINEEEFIRVMREIAQPQAGDVVLLTGVGDVFPYMRVHKLLEAMQPHFSKIPVLVMYPGHYDGNYVRLFNLLEPNPYYRAFNVI